MTDFEKYIDKSISKIIPKYEKLEIDIVADKSSYSVEFFVTNGKERVQNFEMVDNGIIKEEVMDMLLKNIVEEYRKSSEYNPESLNQISLVITK